MKIYKRNETIEIKYYSTMEWNKGEDSRSELRAKRADWVLAKEHTSAEPTVYVSMDRERMCVYRGEIVALTIVHVCSLATTRGHFHAKRPGTRKILASLFLSLTFRRLNCITHEAFARDNSSRKNLTARSRFI